MTALNPTALNPTTPFNNVIPSYPLYNQFYSGQCCNPCNRDPLYNGQLGNGQIGNGQIGNGQLGNGQPNPCKDLCPLKSFCDPGLATTCNPRPIVDPSGPRRAVTTWRVNFLVSNRSALAAHSDTNLVNPWGIVIYNNQLWISNNASDSITNYDIYGNKLLAVISVRDAVHNSSHPTGIVVNCESGFNVTSGSSTRAALFISCTEHGTVHAYNPNVDPLDSFLVLNQQLTGLTTVFKGLAVANNTLYLADFFNARIEVFDSTFNRLTGFHFIDGDTIDPIPIDYAPNNIVRIGCFLYVLYARKDINVTVHDWDGPGHGFVSVFGFDGSFIRRFTSRGVLNSPWAMIPAPCECGFPPGSFLIGNNGDGRINIFDCNGKYVGPMLNMSGFPISIDGLWGLAPLYAEFNQIFFTASADEDTEGLVGSITKDQIIYL